MRTAQSYTEAVFLPGFIHRRGGGGGGGGGGEREREECTVYLP